MTRRIIGWVGLAALSTMLGSTACTADNREDLSTPEGVRSALFAEIQPVKVSNCDLQRFGETNDGGYMVCGNLLGSVESGYSYGISGYDGWGCEISVKLRVSMHQYDCFNTTVPACPDGKTFFHPECVGDSRREQQGRHFDTIENQMKKNGDGERRVVLKIDVEGAEWESFLQTPDDVLDRIDQLVVEFHKTEEPRFVEVVRKLKQQFEIAHLHFNNWSCKPNLKPFPAWAYEVLFVNKRLAVVDSAAAPAARPHRLDTPNDPRQPDCQG